MYYLDSDTLSHYQRGRQSVLNRLYAVTEHDVATTIVTRIEILRSRFDTILKAANAQELRTAQRWLIESEDLLSSWQIVPFNEPSYLQFERLRGMRELRKIGRADLLIGSIALANGAVLVTRNVRDFRLIPGLQIENWVDA